MTSEHHDHHGFAVLDAETFEVKGRWEANGAPRWHYDFWYNPGNGYLVSSEWASPNTFQDGFDLENVAAGRFRFTATKPGGDPTTEIFS